ncbi:hypothetical protein C8Q79DRAFT_928755 [Trametes meyenii]|nr:hypothetical protein C8Q79DRAFT_928755 [Trametes meyenii]
MPPHAITVENVTLGGPSINLTETTQCEHTEAHVPVESPWAVFIICFLVTGVICCGFVVGLAKLLTKNRDTQTPRWARHMSFKLNDRASSESPEVVGNSLELTFENSRGDLERDTVRPRESSLHSSGHHPDDDTGGGWMTWFIRAATQVALTATCGSFGA